MALGRVTYLDLTEEQRREGAARAKARLKALLANPALTTEQRASLQDQMAHLRLWEAGKVPAKPTKPTVPETVAVKEGAQARPAQHHVVEATETVPVKEKV